MKNPKTCTQGTCAQGTRAQGTRARGQSAFSQKARQGALSLACALSLFAFPAAAETPQDADRDIFVSLIAKVEGGLPLRFVPAMKSFPARIGDRTKASYFVKNFSDKTVHARVKFQVTPQAIKNYIHKIQCFSFEDQTLESKKTSKLRVLFLIDPAMNHDPELKDFDDKITFTYTFQPL